MSATVHKLTLPGAMIKRGFWLYVCRVLSTKGEFLYVGRTGDSSWLRASSPLVRLGHHLGTNNPRQNLMRGLLKRDKEISPEECTEIEVVAYGPLFPETRDRETHRKQRDIVAALEKALADALQCGKYQVLNTVKCKKLLCGVHWGDVGQEFSKPFGKIGPGPVSSYVCPYHVGNDDSDCQDALKGPVI